MNDSHILLALFIVTVGIVLVYAVYQITKVRKAKRANEHSALTEGHPEQRSAKGAPGVPPQR